MKALPKGLSIKVGHTVSNRPTTATLYQTEIVTIHHDSNRLILRTGGWRTNHTKKCMNLILKDYSLRIVQKSKKWYLYKTVKSLGCLDGSGTHVLFENDTLELTLD